MVKATRGVKLHRCVSTVVACSFVLAALLVAPGSGRAALRNVSPGSKILDFSLSDAAGGSKVLADFAGKAKLVVFFSGNDRSKGVLKTLDPLYVKYKDDGFDVVAVYTGSDRNEAKAMGEEAKVTFPIFLDMDKKVYGEYGVSVTPVMLLVGKDDVFVKEQPYVPLLGGILEIEVKVLTGKMTREDADLSLKPEDAPKVSAEEKEADKIYGLGLVLMERGMKDKAIEKFKKVLEIDSTYCKVRLQLGHLYLGDNKIDEAREQFEYVLKCDPTSHEAKVGMGGVLLAKGEFDKAIEILESSLQLNPRPEMAYYELGKVYEKKGTLDKAVEFYKKALERLMSK